MPEAADILAGLSGIANQWRGLALIWHGYFAILLCLLWLGKRSSRRLMGVLLALPLLSVSVLAWHDHNPFNGTLFALIGMVAALVLLITPPARVRLSAGWPAMAGVVLMAFGWVYPHFVITNSWAVYLYAAPLGLVPCPTLAMVIGVGLLLDGMGSRPWLWWLALWGGFYGLFGALRLGVGLDWVLLAGAALLAAHNVITGPRSGVTAPP